MQMTRFDFKKMSLSAMWRRMAEECEEISLVGKTVER